MDFLRREYMQTRSIVEKIKRNTWCFSLLEKQAKLYSDSDLLSIKKSTNQSANHNHLTLTKKVPDAMALGCILPKQKIRSQPPSSWLSIKHFCPNFLPWNRASAMWLMPHNLLEQAAVSEVDCSLRRTAARRFRNVLEIDRGGFWGWRRDCFNSHMLLV